ncbi:DUF1272 domain-containing protein [Nocardia sputorum]|uniref:DUF1272 domain-containing protein n=1 Tax=Nocardia sputorum TaxID=2984338 RepID=UPI00331404B2
MRRERCGAADGPARIRGHERAFRARCDAESRGVCPNRGGESTARPHRVPG